MSPNKTESDGTTLLQKAAGPGSASMALVQLLLQRGADINARDQIGGTALYEATTVNHVNIALYLVQQGAKVDATTVNGVTIGWSVKRRLDTLQDGPVRKQYEQLRDLLIAKGAKWPPESPEIVRDHMRAKGEKVVIPAGQKR